MLYLKVDLEDKTEARGEKQPVMDRAPGQKLPVSVALGRVRFHITVQVKHGLAKGESRGFFAQLEDSRQLRVVADRAEGLDNILMARQSEVQVVGFAAVYNRCKQTRLGITHHQTFGRERALLCRLNAA